MTEKLSKPKYIDLGKFLRQARKGESRSVDDLVEMLKGVTPNGVSRSFVYLVEKGWRKPSDGKVDQWASAYGVGAIEVWKRIGKLPLWHAQALLSGEGGAAAGDKLSQLSEEEKAAVEMFVEFIILSRPRSVAG